MGLPKAAVDSDAFVRTASRFARKRETLDAGSIQAVSREIVERLSRSRETGFEPGTAAIDPVEIENFCHALMQPSPTAALDFINQRRASGLTRQGVYFGYIGAAARHLGAGWEDDSLSFVEVTIATGHLYALMRSLRAEALVDQPPHDIGRSAMFATVPGEDHGIGISVAAGLFREAGWDIDLHIGANMAALVARIEASTPSIIGLSVTTNRHLDSLVRLVVAARLIVPHAIIGVAPGAGVDPAALHDLVDIDLVFGDARSALAELDRLRWLKAAGH